jgi:SAM-dependent methyltransferase
MCSNDDIGNEQTSKPEKPSQNDLARLKWIDPCNDAKFTRKEPVISQDASSESLLQNIMSLVGEIFDDLSVLEQFPETTSRGAKAVPEKKIYLPEIRNDLDKIEKELWKIYVTLKNERNSFVKKQFDSLSLGESYQKLKINIGSGANLFKDWINIDVGGADLTLNVNWGLPFPDNSANFVYSAHLLEHLRYSDQAPVFVREIYRILNKGGVVRFVIPDVRKLLVAYAENDQEFFKSRQDFYPLSEGFLNKGVAALDYILLFCGAAPQLLNFNHKFGYDSNTLCNLLLSAGFQNARECSFQGSSHPELQLDDFGYNASTKNHNDQHFSLFVEATK